MGASQPRKAGLQFSSNVLVNAIAFATNVIVGILLVPFFINELGVAAYGLVPLATSVTSYVAVIADSMGTATSRFLTKAFNSSEPEKANSAYTTSVIGMFFIVLMLIPVIIIVAFLSPYFFDVASNSNFDVMALFLLVFSSMLINVLGYGFVSVLFAKNRVDCHSAVKFLQVFLQASFILILFNVFPPSLVNIGVAYIFAACLSLIVLFVLVKRIYPGSKVRRSEFDRSLNKEIMSLSRWEVVDRIGVLLLIQASLVITNPLLGAEIAGKFAVVVMVITAISVFAGTMSSAFTPVTYMKYEIGKKDEMVRICTSGAKVVGIILAMPVAFVCVFSAQIFTIWVGPSFTNLSPVLFLMLFVLAGSLSFTPIIPISTAYFKVKMRSLATVSFGMLNIVLAVVFVMVLDMGLMGIAIGWATSEMLRSWVFLPYYHRKITGRKDWGFYRPTLTYVTAFIPSVIIGMIINTHFTVPASIIVLLVILMIWFIVYLMVIPRLLLNENERDIIRQCLPSSIEKRISKKIL